MEHTIFKDMRKEDELQKAKALSDEIKNNTGVYPPDDLTFRGGF